MYCIKDISTKLILDQTRMSKKSAAAIAYFSEEDDPDHSDSGSDEEPDEDEEEDEEEEDNEKEEDEDEDDEAAVVHGLDGILEHQAAAPFDSDSDSNSDSNSDSDFDPDKDQDQDENKHNDKDKEHDDQGVTFLSKRKSATSIQLKGKKEEYDEHPNEDEDHNGDGHGYLQKFTRAFQEQYVPTYHSECITLPNEEMAARCVVVRNKDGVVVDEYHNRTLPLITKYERTRILGLRATQLANNAPPFVTLPDSILDPLTIARMEYDAKKIMMIIRRPLPDGTSEYWRVHDLEDIIP